MTESFEPRAGKSEVIKDASDMQNDPMTSLIETLDFRASSELIEASSAIVDGISKFGDRDPRIRAAWVEYAKISEQMIDGNETDRVAYSRAQIAAIIHKSLIFRAVGNNLRYISELDSAEVYAFNEGLDEISSGIQTEIDTVIDTLEMSPEVFLIKLKGVVSEANREHLRDLIDQGDDLDDMIGNVYAIILEEGGDPDEILGGMGVLDLD